MDMDNIEKIHSQMTKRIEYIRNNDSFLCDSNSKEMFSDMCICFDILQKLKERCSELKK